MSDRSNHPTGGRRRKFKSPATRAVWEEATARSQPPALPDHLRGDDDGLTCSDEEKEAYDRVMGVSSVSPRETAGFGEGNATDVEENHDGVANISGDIEET